jgi:dolichol-phosphate mannosyltransferase
MSKSLVIILTYNERENVQSIVEAVLSLEIPFHVLIVDDNSPDGTAAIVEELQQDIFFRDRLFLEKRGGKQGLGTAYIHGFKFALSHEYEYIFEMDADFSHNPDDLVPMYKTCSLENFDLVIGSRYVTGVNVVNWPIGRVLMSIFASWYVRTITGMPIHDTTAGFKCYRRKVLETIELDRIKFVGYAFQIEMKFSAWRCGFRIKEIPIIFTDRTRGESKMSKGIFKEAVFGVIQMKVGSWFRKYNSGKHCRS